VKGLPGEGKYGQSVRGFANAVSKSVRPSKNLLPTELDNGGRKNSYSTGTPYSTSVAPKQKKSAPALTPVPRGYVHGETSAQPHVTNTSAGRLRKGSV
jgi:hypothetical protein